MLDLFVRAIVSPKNFLRVYQTHQLTFLDLSTEGESTYIFNFKPNQSFTWKAGQHGLFFFPNLKVSGKSWRVFSIASAPHEAIIKIATTILPKHSDFKQKLLSLKPGDQVSMRGPVGKFYITKQTPMVVGIAGGIGITPFRAILSQLLHLKNPNTQLELIYAGKDDFFAFRDLCTLGNELPAIQVHFVNSPDQVNAKLNELTNRYGNKSVYYISGSPGMIEAIRKTLKKHGIRKIISDPFKGY